MKQRTVLGVTAALTAFLVVGGSATAIGAWVTNATATSTAAAATVGVTSTLASGSSLGITYSSTATTGVGSVTVTNTGNRTGTYSLNATATSASSALRSAVTVELGTATTCTAGATLTGVVSGTFAAAVVKSGSLAAGASTTLCVRTSMTSTDITARQGESLAATLATSIAVSSWSAQASPITFTQQVAASAVFQPDFPSRYRILNQNLCIKVPWSTFDVLSRGTTGGDCSVYQLSQWRLVDAGGGTFLIQHSHKDNPTPLRYWTANSATSAISATGSSGANKRWSIVQRPDGKYRFVNQAYPTKCLQVNLADSEKLTFATCNDSSAVQGFTFELVENASPQPVALSCSGNTYSLSYSWPQLDGFEGDVVYRVYINGVFIMEKSNGWWPVAMFDDGDVPGAQTGTGIQPVEVKQSVGGAAWTTTGTGSILITSIAGGYTIACG